MFIVYYRARHTKVNFCQLNSCQQYKLYTKHYKVMLITNRPQFGRKQKH